MTARSTRACRSAGPPSIGADGTPLLDAQGEPLRTASAEREKDVARALVEGPVYARLDMADEALQDWLRRGQPNCFLPYDRLGIDPFRDLFRVTLRAEGTVRGTGGIRVISSELRAPMSPASMSPATRPAARTLLAPRPAAARSIPPGRSPSGWWAGKGASGYAKRRGGPRRSARFSSPLGTAGLRPAGTPRPIDTASGDRGRPRRGDPAREELSSATAPRLEASLRTARGALARGAGASRAARVSRGSAPARPPPSPPPPAGRSRRRSPGPKAAACTAARICRSATTRSS